MSGREGKVTSVCSRNVLNIFIQQLNLIKENLNAKLLVLVTNQFSYFSSETLPFLRLFQEKT